MFVGIAAVMEVLSHRKPACAKNLELVFLLHFNLPYLI
jgi:hypothetical protein